MTVRILRLENRLAKLIRTPAGAISVSHAMKRAQANLETIREDCLRSVDESLERMGVLFAAGGGLADGPALYSLSKHIVGVAGAMQLTGLSQAAYSLCDALDGMEQAGRWEPIIVQVHLEAMRSLRQAGSDTAISTAIIDGLKKVAAQIMQE